MERVPLRPANAGLRGIAQIYIMINTTKPRVSGATWYGAGSGNRTRLSTLEGSHNKPLYDTRVGACGFVVRGAYGRDESRPYAQRTTNHALSMVGATRLERATSCSQSRRSSQLSYAPMKSGVVASLRRASGKSDAPRTAYHARSLRTTGILAQSPYSEKRVRGVRFLAEISISWLTLARRPLLPFPIFRRNPCRRQNPEQISLHPLRSTD
jgi:hypothetical protein